MSNEIDFLAAQVALNVNTDADAAAKIAVLTAEVNDLETQLAAFQGEAATIADLTAKLAAAQQALAAAVVPAPAPAPSV